ncbi:hypothetical protein CONLIGDRAFT_641794 [Coniochaeta ligniaria NRRL 30616]|uniref:F-box domain-containing protein n=1 Tax=Coniochaeta ligniaria NRRL 30616 TaxID=1408157 RepID=A0A1J7JRP2_9PEZI|nr:hypothetical protein CONLIGDRAFT_641794 [Coniochaeta ligniaria NRRL 30616]
MSGPTAATSVEQDDKLSLSKEAAPPSRLDGLPPEIILDIFYELLDSTGSVRGLCPLTATSKHFYSCFKDSEFAIFRRAINILLKGDLNFCDFLIKAGVLRSIKPWPTSPAMVNEALMPLITGCCLFDITGKGQGFTEAERSQINCSMYRGILYWVASAVRYHEFCLVWSRSDDTRFLRHAPSSDNTGRAVSTARMKVGLPAISEPLARHPFDCLRIVEQAHTNIRVYNY